MPAQPHHQPLLISTREAAHLLGLSPRTLEGLRLRGDGPRFVKLGRRTVRYRPEDLEAFVASGLRESTAEVLRPESAR